MLVPLAPDNLLACLVAIIGRRAARHEGWKTDALQGKGSDKQYGRTWLREQIRKQNSTPAAEPVPAINIAAVYNGPVTRSVVSQNNAASSSSKQVCWIFRWYRWQFLTCTIGDRYSR
jgi:hypothetical protein